MFPLYSSTSEFVLCSRIVSIDFSPTRSNGCVMTPPTFVGLCSFELSNPFCSIFTQDRPATGGPWMHQLQPATTPVTARATSCANQYIPFAPFATPRQLIPQSPVAHPRSKTLPSTAPEQCNVPNCCMYSLQPPLTPSKARAGGWENKNVLNTSLTVGVAAWKPFA